MRLELVATLARLYEFAEVAPGSVWTGEEVVHKLCGGGHEIVSCGAVDRESALAVFEPGRKDEGGEVAAVIDVKVTEEEDIGLGHLRSTLSEAESAASSGVEDDAGGAVIPDEIAGGGALSCDSGPPEPRTCTAIPEAPHDCAVAGEGVHVDKSDVRRRRTFRGGFGECILDLTCPYLCCVSY
jgi:hypothetical protein